MAAPPLAAVLKRQEEAAPELLRLVSELAQDATDVLLPKLAAWSTAPWSRPRGDLCHWRDLLRRLDRELNDIVSQYDFADGPVVLSAEHEEVAVVVLRFTATLAENCANRVVYPSMPILSQLIESANISVVASTLLLLTKFLPRKGSNFAATKLLSTHVSPTTVTRLCTIVPTQVASGHCELQDFYELSFSDWSLDWAAIEPLSGAQVRDMPLGDLVKTVRSPDLRYRLWLAKAFAGDAETRRHMVFAQCHAAAVCIYMLQSTKFTATVLSTAPTTIHAIAKLVNPEDDRQIVPELRLLGVQTLQHICFDYESIGMTVLRRCNNLGIMSLLPGITRAARANEPIDEEFVSCLFGLLRYTSTGNLVSIGLISLALEFVAVKTTGYLRSRTACVSFLNSLVMEVPSANNAFLESNGIEVVLQVLEQEIDLARVTALNESAPTFCITDHSLGIDRVRWVCSGVVLLANLLTLRRSSALLRRLLDSPLLTICQRLISHPHVFSGRNAALALDLVVALVKQDENTIQILQERQLITPMLQDTMQLFDPKMRQYPAGLAFYVAMQSILPSNCFTDANRNTIHVAIVKAFAAISEDILNIPMFTFRQIGRAAFTNLGGAPADRDVLIAHLFSLYSTAKSTLFKRWSQRSSILVDSNGTEWFPSPNIAYALDALIHLSETALEEPAVMSAFLKADGHIRLLSALSEGPLPYNFSERAVGKTRLYRLFRRMYQLSANRPAFLMDCMAYLCKLAANVDERWASMLILDECNMEDLWAVSSFCFAAQLVCRVMFVNVRSAGYVIRNLADRSMQNFMSMLGTIHLWALRSSSAWTASLNPELELATNPIAARVACDMGPGVGLSVETSAADIDHVQELFNGLPAELREEAQEVRAQRWLCVRTHTLCAEILGNIAMYATADEIYEADPKLALMAAKTVAERCVEELALAAKMDNCVSTRHTVLFMMIDHRSMLMNDRKLLNIGAYVFFCQLGGLTSLVSLLTMLTSPSGPSLAGVEKPVNDINSRVYLPEKYRAQGLYGARGPTQAIFFERHGGVSVYLAPGCTPSDLLDETIVYVLERLDELLAAPSATGESLFSSEFCTRSSGAEEPEYFSMAQFYVEIRIEMLIEMREKVSLEVWSRIPALALDPLQRVFESLFAEAPSDSDDMALPASDMERDRLPLVLVPEDFFDLPAKAHALASTGEITYADAETALKDNEGSVRLVCQTLGLSLPPETLFEKEQAVGSAHRIGRRKFKVLDDLHDLRDMWRDWIGEYLFAIVDSNPKSPFYAAQILAQVTWTWEEVERTRAAEVFRTLLAELEAGTISRSRLYFLAVLAGYSWMAQEIRPRLARCLPQLSAMVIGDDESMVAFAATLMEKTIVEDGSVAEAVSRWADTQAGGFVAALARQFPLADDVSSVAVARLLLIVYWQTNSYELSLGLLDSGIIEHFMASIRQLEGNITGQQLQTVTLLLMRSVVEPEEVQTRVMQTYLAKEIMRRSPRAEIDVTVESLAELFIRNPQLMVEVCTKDTYYDQTNKVLHLRVIYEKYAEHINAYIRAKGYEVPLVGPPNARRGPAPRQPPRPQVGKLVHLVVHELLAQPYAEAYAAANALSAAKFDIADAAWVEFRRVANYANYLLVTLYELCDVSEIARQALLFYPQPLEAIPGDLTQVPSAVSPALAFLLEVICAYDQGSAACLAIAEPMARTAGQLVYSLTYMAAESFVDAETVRIRKARTAYICGIFIVLLKGHFDLALVPPASTLTTCQRHRLLASVVSILVLVLRINALPWTSVEPRPFVALAVLASGVPEVVARCLGLANTNDPVIAEAREKIYTFFFTAAFYDSMDVDNMYPCPAGERALVLESRSFEPSVVDMLANEDMDSRSFRRNVIRDLTPPDVYETMAGHNFDLFGSSTSLDRRGRSVLVERRQSSTEHYFDRPLQRSLLSPGLPDSESPGIDIASDHMETEDESNITDPLFSNPELESWHSDMERDEDDGYVSYENVSDAEAASLGSDDSRDLGESELEQAGDDGEEMFSDDEESDHMDIELVLEPASGSGSEAGDSDYYTTDGSENVDEAERSASETSGAVFDENSIPPQPSRASMLAQLYAQDVDDYESSEEESDSHNDSIDILDEEALVANPYELEAGLRFSATGRPISVNGHGALPFGNDFGDFEDSQRAFSMHPTTRENYLDMVIYRMDDGDAYMFSYEDLDLQELLTESPVQIEPHILARATDCILGGAMPSIARVSPLQMGAQSSDSAAATAFIEFSNKRTVQRWEDYGDYVGLPKHTTFVRKAQALLLHAIGQTVDANNRWLDSLYRTADAVWEVETHNPPEKTFFDMSNNEMDLEVETDRYITSGDVDWSSEPVVTLHGGVEMPWSQFNLKHSSASMWSSTLIPEVVHSQLRLLFAPWPTPNDAELMCREISAMPWDLFYAFIQGLFKILVDVSEQQGGLESSFWALTPEVPSDEARSLIAKTLYATSIERVLHQTMFLLIALHEMPKFRTLLAIVDGQNFNGHWAINVLLKLLDRQVFLTDSVLLERLLLLTHHIVRFVVKKLKQTGNLGVSELVSQENLQRLMRVWTAHECTSNAFRYAVESVRLLSQLSDINDWVNHQLVLNIEEWISRMIAELEDLQLNAEPEERLIARITSYTSVQAMLLRLLTVVRFNSQLDTQDIMVELLRRESFEPLIRKLDGVLASNLSTSDQFTRIASLRPLIESLILVGKVTATSKLDRQHSESFRKSIFAFIGHHSALFNQLVYKNSTQLLNDSVSMLEDSMQLLTFENRKLYFANRMNLVRQLSHRNTVQIKVSRATLLEDSMLQLMELPAQDLRAAQIEVHFDGEEGIDQGGLNREWYSEMTKAIFQSEHGLFEQYGSGLHPKFSLAKSDKFEFVGRFIGKAMFDGQLLDVVLSLPTYKYLLGEKITFEDLKTVDEEYYNSLKWMLENDITDVIEEVFALEVPEQPDVPINLITNGANIPVTEANKAEYVQLRGLWKLLNGVKPQLRALKHGFYEIMDADLVKLFNPKELELVISGIPKIDITDWRLNTEYEGYSAASPQVRWFWRTVKSFDHSQRAKLLQFCTGSAKVPIDGFEHLPAGKFNISRDRQSADRLPSSHTCTNHLCLPEYPSYETLRAALSKAVLDGAGSFGLA